MMNQNNMKICTFHTRQDEFGRLWLSTPNFTHLALQSREWNSFIHPYPSEDFDKRHTAEALYYSLGVMFLRVERLVMGELQASSFIREIIIHFIYFDL